jgi:hypothetical protein
MPAVPNVGVLFGGGFMAVHGTHLADDSFARMAGPGAGRGRIDAAPLDSWIPRTADDRKFAIPGASVRSSGSEEFDGAVLDQVFADGWRPPTPFRHGPGL